MRRLTIGDLIVSCGLAVLILATLLPAVARLQRPWAEAKCQANMRRWAEAALLYAEDNDRRYPTNRVFRVDGSLSPVMPRILLTLLGELDPQGNQARFKYGLAWVEDLYPYIWDAAARTGRDWTSFMRCPNASSALLPPSPPNARMTYTFNRNLIEYPAPLAQNPAKVMMLREFDRLVNSELRPINQSVGSTTMPQSPFLTTSDPYVAKTDPNRHGTGSYIAFADGHIGYFTTDYYPTLSKVNKTNCWDESTQQWWNWGPNSGKPAQLIKAIAITP